ncbi:MAG: hypothetical protein JTJ23_12905 [Fusicatenibacter saccharivorans]|uniref:Uncharacterized protein n=1 Tax=Fusicatenibacter saccharivorans TaxID=1150298 RepID=A0A939CGP4_9FIRM|nr:hypothetical protein [Fusicatenibacter saccharivorans]
MAETYGIFDYRQLPLRVVAALFSGLREESRLGQKMHGVRGDRKDLLLAVIADETRAIHAALIGADYPQSITAELFENSTNNQAEGHGNTAVYESKEDFMKARYGGEK